ncbi:MAG: DinB family protein [Terracidiphilus sp.]
MSQQNPYDIFLDGRPLDAILGDSPGSIASLLEAIGSANASKAPAPGKWSAAEIVAHLADCELVFGFRLRQTLAEDDYTIQPFDQDRWAVSSDYSAIGAGQALATFTALRNWNLQLIARSLPAAANRPVSHPERGAMTFQTIVETMAGHDLNHLEQLARIAASPTPAA